MNTQHFNTGAATVRAPGGRAWRTPSKDLAGGAVPAVQSLAEKSPSGRRVSLAGGRTPHNGDEPCPRRTSVGKPPRSGGRARCTPPSTVGPRRYRSCTPRRTAAPAPAPAAMVVEAARGL